MWCNSSTKKSNHMSMESSINIDSMRMSKNWKINDHMNRNERRVSVVAVASKFASAFTRGRTWIKNLHSNCNQPLEFPQVQRITT